MTTATENTNTNTNTDDTNAPSNAYMNTALVDLTNANEKEQGAGLRFACALFDYRTALPHSLKDMVHNKTVHKVDKKSGRTGTDLESVNALHVAFLSTLPAYKQAIEDAGKGKAKAKLTAIEAMDTDKTSLAMAKKENAVLFINKTRVAMVRAVSIAYFLDSVGAMDVSVSKNGKEMSFDMPIKDANGKDAFKRIHYTYSRLANAAKQHIVDVKLKPAPQPQSQQGQGQGATQATSTPVATAETLSALVQSMPVDKRKEMAETPQSETLLCNLLAARFMKDRVLDLPAFYAWVATQSYFKTDGHSINGQIVPSSELIKKEKVKASGGR